MVGTFSGLVSDSQSEFSRGGRLAIMLVWAAGTTPPVEPEKATNWESESEWGDMTSRMWLRDYIMYFSKNKDNI